MTKHTRSALSLMGLILLGGVALGSEAVFHVDAALGNDTGDGSAAHPFRTLTRAREAVRTLKKGGLPHDGVAVELNGEFSSVTGRLLELSAADSGDSPERPIVWRAGKKGACLSGACRLTAADFAPVTGAARARLRPAVQDKVLCCDLAKFGVAPLAPLPDKFNKWTEMELVANGRAMTIARYPNQGWLEITNVIDRGVAPKDPTKGEWEVGIRGGTFSYSGTEPERWNLAKGAYLFGFWCYDWASDFLRIGSVDAEKKTITMAAPHFYGLGKASKWAKAKVRYFAFNILEELDAPGEWHLDRETRTLYFYPPAEGLNEVALSLAKTPLVQITRAANVVLKGVTFRYTTGLAVSVSNSKDITLDALDISWLTVNGVQVAGGKDNVVQNCRIREIGSVGLSLTGGDRKSLTKCNFRVVNNDIGHCGRLARIAGPCCTFQGCGMTIEHNYFHDTPYIAMSYGGNEHLIQYNEVECAMLEAGDGAGIYTGRDWGSRGNVLRWNYLHHFGKDGVALREAQGRPSGCEPLKKDVMVEGIYLDDCDSGETIYGNLFYKAGRAMFTGGGRDNKWRHNLVLDCTTAAHFDVRGLQRAKPGSGRKDGWDLLAKIEANAYTNEPWASRYPELIGIMQKEPLLPIGTAYVSNVAVNCGFFFNCGGEARKFLQDRAPNCANVCVSPTNAERDRADYPQTNAVARTKLEVREDVALVQAAADPRTCQDSPAFKAAFPDFPRIPVEKIGLFPAR